MDSVKLYTLGCRQNQYDTEIIREDFESSGWHVVSKDNNPECIIVNTCSVTNSAERQARNLLNRLLRENPCSRIIMTGCYARNNPKIDPKIEILPSRDDITREFTLQSNKYITKFANHTKAFISIQNGCDRFCSYCIIPYLRGNPTSRPKEDIEEEIRVLSLTGYRVFILTGINIGKYSYNGSDLISLLESILDIDGVELLGISSVEPETITSSFIDFVGKEDRFYRWLHISLQSGCNKILKLMGRNYARLDERKMINILKDNNKDMCIGTDIICGFPGEGEKEFDETRTLLNELPLSYFHVFRFSARKFTKAFDMPDKPRAEIVKERSRIIRELGKQKFYNFRNEFIGREMKVLVENRKLEEFLVGTTNNYIKVLFKGPANLMGKFTKVRIEKIEAERTLGIKVN
ncbi:MiaB/RimO family radical SAM methylthiotransferase [candidate division WOR-3 bacterium]|nr:MiaB/RimO family radical SAM methylthiotransferase [candidate division WOR-3 bacterium]